MEKDEEKLHEARFLGLVLSLQNSAWISLGKIANPLTGKVEKDLRAARGSIDLLETLKVKTRGNLSEQEEKVLVDSLSTLQINFVEESSKEAPGKKERSDEGPQGKEKESPKETGG